MLSSSLQKAEEISHGENIIPCTQIQKIAENSDSVGVLIKFLTIIVYLTLSYCCGANNQQPKFSKY